MTLTYLLSYNPLDLKVSPSQLATLIQESRKLQAWYSPFPGTYFLKSAETTQTLASMFSGLFDGSPFTLTFIVPTHMGGRLSPDIWTWLNTGTVPTLNALANTGKATF